MFPLKKKTINKWVEFSKYFVGNDMTCSPPVNAFVRRYLPVLRFRLFFCLYAFSLKKNVNSE